MSLLQILEAIQRKHRCKIISIGFASASKTLVNYSTEFGDVYENQLVSSIIEEKKPKTQETYTITEAIRMIQQHFLGNVNEIAFLDHTTQSVKCVIEGKSFCLVLNELKS